MTDRRRNAMDLAARIATLADECERDAALGGPPEIADAVRNVLLNLAARIRVVLKETGFERTQRPKKTKETHVDSA